MKSFSRSFSFHPTCAQNYMNALIPVYNADRSLFAWASEQRFARLQSAGLVARVVRRRNGRVARAILFLRQGEPKPMSASSDLKPLGGNRDGKTYAPPEMRADFLQVVADCRVP